MGYSRIRSFSHHTSSHRLAAIAIAFVLVASACSYLPGYNEPSLRHSVEPEIVPSPTPDPAIAARWQLDRDLIPVREDWPRSTYHDQFEGCRDRGFGGRVRDGYLLIDVPPEPHTQEVVRKAIAEHLCLAGNAEYAPPGHLRILQAHFTTIEIKEWAGQMDRILGEEGIEVTSMGTGNAFNRINAGLLNLADELRARELLDANGIPQHAVNFEQRGYVQW